MKSFLSMSRSALFATAVVALTISTQARAELINGLTSSGSIVSFDSATPGMVFGTQVVAGLASGQSLVGIDTRPADRALIGLALDNMGNGQVYRINRDTGFANSISAMFSLTGNAFGVDFNPVPNAFRIVSNTSATTGNNVRVPMGGTGTAANDMRHTLNGDPFNGIVGAAYSNNVAGGNNGQTTLYVVDSVGGDLYTQGSVNFFVGQMGGVSPNTGQLFFVGDLGLGTNLTTNIGFDISGATGNAFLSVSNSLYGVNTGNAGTNPLGTIGADIIDITVAPVPEPATLGMMAAAIGLLAAARARRKA